MRASFAVRLCRPLVHALAIVPMAATLPGALVTYDWPTAPGEALLSDRYAVVVSAAGETRNVETLVSEAWDDPGGGPDIFRGRTFSWASFAASYEDPVTVTVTKLFGDGTPDVEVFPSGYNVARKVSADGRSVTFRLRQSHYLSVNFKTGDNRIDSFGTIRHLLMIFADPLEATPPPDPDEPGTIAFGPTTTAAEVAATDTILFPPGFHDLRGRLQPGTDDDGLLLVRDDHTVHLAGGAFVVGKIVSHTNRTNITVRGRGAITGRAWDWPPAARADGRRSPSLIDFDGNHHVVEGVHAFDNDMHGIVPGFSATLRHVKMWGWHHNNDGFRPWGGLVEHCFGRPADDAFYVGGRDLEVRNTVIWQSFNGAVVTCGWGSPTNPYDTRGFVMRDCHVLYPEWQNLGNNNGIIASQLPYNASSEDILIENLRVDGNVAGLTNLKRNEALDKIGSPGGITNVTLRNVIITGDQRFYNFDRTVATPRKSVLRGDDGFALGNLEFDNVRIGGTLLTEANRDDHFTVEGPVNELVFSQNQPPPPAELVLHGLVDVADGDFWFEFESRWGESYGFEYSSDLSGWTRHDQTFHGTGQPVAVPVGLVTGLHRGSVFVRVVSP
ncbi:hypothetical protein BH23VER1_BH23VER1_18080 [soil metagenome]